MNQPPRGTTPGASAPWSTILALVGFVGLCLLVGAVDGAMASRSLRTWYLTLNQPPGTPPAGLFAPVWTVLYVTIGVAGWLVWRRLGAGAPLRLWGWQLLANAMWVPAFFGLRSPLAGAVMATVQLVLIGLTVWRFLRVRRSAGLLLVPYAAWTLYAAYLAWGFWVVN